MTTKPILFSAPMVRAILAGTKTQTRRIVKPQPANPRPTCDEHIYSDTINPVTRYFACKFGLPGDTLWVKETFCVADDGVDRPFAYRADNWVECPSADGKWKPSIFMPRAASRITIEITVVRVERLNDISNAEAEAEGCDPAGGALGYDLITTGMWADRLGVRFKSWAKARYAILWESINGTGSWDANPWVWVIQFRRVRP